MLTVNIDRIKQDVMELGQIGRNSADRGIYRMAFSPADMEGRRWLHQRMEQAGLSVSRDGAGNISGRLPHPGSSQQPRFIIGSHIDTVPCAGMLDGALGVLVGLECLRQIAELKLSPPVPLELVSFSDEEGRFGNMFGSEAFTGKLTLERLESACDLDGIRLWDAMGEAGLNPLRALDAQRRPEEILGYLELHIEQGPILDKKGIPIGIVEDITGLFKWGISFQGVANHAGTTPMDMRQDALLGLADFAHEIGRILDENGSRLSRATIGRAQILPGSANTVPGRVDFSLDVRDTSLPVLEDLTQAFRRALSAIARRRGLTLDYEQQSWIRPIACDKDLTHRLIQSAETLGKQYLRMPSGAAHDAQILASLTPVAMIFVPSQDGLSHSPAEWTNWSDVEDGANVMLHFLMQLNPKKV